MNNCLIWCQHHLNFLIQLLKIHLFSVFFRIDRVRKQMNWFTSNTKCFMCGNVSYTPNFKYSYRIVFEISWLKKIFCDDRTSKQTYAFTPNLLCNHFSIQVIHMSNLKILDLIVLKISRYRKFVWVGLTNEQTDGYKPKI